MKLFIATLALVALLVGTVNAWHCTGHMLTAEIAQRAAPTTAKHFTSLVTYWAKKYERIDTMTQAACWPDDFRTQNASMNEWHFHDGCYSPKGLPCPKNPRGELYEILPQAVQVLSSSSTTTDQKAFYFMYLLHLTGDLHQPLHTTSRITSDFPQGDRGGNSVKVHYMRRTAENLHSFCDTVGELYGKDPERPFSSNPDSKSFIEDTAAALMKNYTFPSSASAFNGNFTAWGEESFQYAVSDIYLNNKLKTHDQVLTDSYIKNARQMLQGRVVLGGLRLASVMKYIVKNSNSDNKKKHKKN
eukprot:PhM_4_TR2808/c0_g2_i1/m.29785